MRRRDQRMWVEGCLSAAGTVPAVALLVQKFGGTSVADPERIREVADHVARCRRRGDDVVLVVSAMGKETDELLRAHVLQWLHKRRADAAIAQRNAQAVEAAVRQGVLCLQPAGEPNLNPNAKA